MEQSELHITINETLSYKFSILQRARWLHFIYETTSLSGRKRQTVVGEIHPDNLPELIHWLQQRR